MSADRKPYIGRFAPSPTGPLHFGSLIAAAASYLDARAAGGRWLVRVEDIDPPREEPGAADAIVAALDAFGFEWDGEIVYQSRSAAKHRAAAEGLMARGLAYRCNCSRRQLAGKPEGPLGVIYPGTCRQRSVDGDAALRVMTTDEPISIDDRLQGTITQRLESESGDFIIWRRDGLVAYHLAVVVDDADQGITDIVRGIDLLDSTPRQVYLQRLLEVTTPRYAHIPVAIAPHGDKLSKATGAPGLVTREPRQPLVDALAALRLPVPDGLADEPLAAIWDWAIASWSPAELRGVTDIAVQHYC